jgi:predicted phosphodiesterase
MSMKIAAISDIHGNLGALDAVLTDIVRRGVDMIVNLGDILSGGLQPAATADRLMALDMPTIRGNHERQVLAGDPARMGASDRFAHDNINDAQRRWLAGLPATLRLSDEVLLVHGTPRSDLTYFLDVVTPEGARPATSQEVAVLAGDAGRTNGRPASSLILCGHTHMPRRMLLDDGRLIVNPGSVGLQAYDDAHPYYHRMENGSPHARYAIVERKASGWTAMPIAVAYDWDAAAALAARNGHHGWVHPLRTGFVGVKGAH